MPKFTNPYATDGRCHNAEPGTYGHECGEPAVWIAQESDFSDGYGFCQHCREHGYEARRFPIWWMIQATR